MLVPYLIVAATGLLMALVGIPLWKGMVGPNWFYGFRTPRTITNESLWYTANRVTGRDLILAGLAQVVLCGAALLLHAPEVSLGVVAVVPTMIAMAHSGWVTCEAAYLLDNRAEIRQLQ